MVGCDPEDNSIFYPVQRPNNPAPPNVLIHLDDFESNDRTKCGVGAGYAVLRDGVRIQNWSARLNPSNSVFQAELMAIFQGLSYLEINHPSSAADLYSDSLSSLEALLNPIHRNPLVRKIQKILKGQKDISLSWIKGHAGQVGNEAADFLAKQAANDSSTPLILNMPVPKSFIKQKLQEHLKDSWNTRWQSETTGRRVHSIFPNPSLKTRIKNRSDTLLVTGHGPFPAYLSRFKIIPSPNCACGLVGTPDHYLYSCPLTSQFHLKMNNSITIPDNIRQALSHPSGSNSIHNLISELTIRNYEFQEVS
ncbi:uncharacterized protein LOC129222894 [Uloborus diversus]|uniref:uncharacterized protein LOC129222894 n=1 Tax=Uloborus diversus TaxID=327109 RepID=UPI0024093868|nr:uncharacterized protein LOC129222894 [Uloborus diversus]